MVILMYEPMNCPQAWMMVVVMIGISNIDRHAYTRAIPVIVIPIAIGVAPRIIRTESIRRGRSVVVIDYHILFTSIDIGIGYCIGNNRLRLVYHACLTDD